MECGGGIFRVPLVGPGGVDRVTAMPRDGSMILSNLRKSMLTIVCEPCGRRGRYSVEKLIAEHGDAKLTDLLVSLADCPKARSVSIHDRCKAVYDGL
jgi:hypothetical protein